MSKNSINTTFIIPTTMFDKLIEWKMQNVMPFFKQVLIHSTANHNRKTEPRTLNFDDGDHIKIRRVHQDDDECIPEGCFICNKSFSDTVRRINDVQRQLIYKAEVKIDKAIVQVGGHEYVYDAKHSGDVLEVGLKKQLEQIIGENLPTNRSMIMVCTNSHEIPQTSKSALWTETKTKGKVHGFTRAKVITRQEKVDVSTYDIYEE